MPSSLAAALAASSAAKSLDRNKNELTSSPSYSRSSSLMQYKKKYEVVENNKSAEDQITSLKIAHEKKGPIGNINNNSKHDNAGKNLNHDDTSKNSIQLQRKNNTFTKKNYKRTGYTDAKDTSTPTSTTSVSSIFNETGGVVFICDVPSGNDDEAGVDNSLDVDNDCGERDIAPEKMKKKGGYRKKKGRSKVNLSDSVAIASPCTSEVVFLCDIPSDDSDDGDSDRINHRHHRNNMLEEDTRHRDRENIGRRKDVVRNISGHNIDGVTSRSGDTTDAVYSPQGDGRSHDRFSTGPNPPASSGPMPTPWSTRAQSMKNKRVDNLTTNHQSRHSNLPASHSTRHSTDFCSTKECKSPVRHNVSNPSQPSSVVPACTQHNSFSTNCSEAAAAPIKLEPTALKGRWADEDSNSDDE